VKVLFTISNITEQQEEHLASRFRNCTFTFLKDKDELTDHIKEAEILVTYGSDVTEEIINEANQLKWIQVLSAGVNNLPLEAISAKGILVTNARGIHKVPMSEYALSMLLHVYRREDQVVKDQVNKHWNRKYTVKEISGKTLLVLGTGAIGQEVARLAKAFHMKTIGISRSGEKVDYFDENYGVNHLNSLLPKGDFIISVLPSTKETAYLLREEHFELMKEDAVFLNMGRGDLVSTETLIKVAQEKKIAHLILDVFEEEPLPKDSPLWSQENVTITPHISGVSSRYLERALGIFKENMHIYGKRKEELINKINLERGY